MLIRNDLISVKFHVFIRFTLIFTHIKRIPVHINGQLYIKDIYGQV